ncbi:hypothetical protein PMIN06_009265 [Paraphaeosphaeria minitans]|uniref:Uncharacterized protein n=1 Tax=Paraphaeosphaeria minitans TaxID=565426 RepID=A0A9P6GJK8_9PLEO|nr:hypothetical protein PMIN01_06282 [Paraphaeosphaeria minitans]
MATFDPHHYVLISTPPTSPSRTPQPQPHPPHSLDFTWHRDNHHTPSTARPSPPIPIRMPTCLLTHIFLIHPVITAEYTESCSPNLETVLNPSGFRALEDFADASLT